ncbi:hypothetical protein [Streptomyces sp. NPDC020489]|uniref:hypothetical protein n=1 Tax=Streptomyces sp. NPDC020489 TaxID=3365077 RepID=UPI0037970347
MNTPHLPWPVPDPRAHYFVNQYADMHELVADLVVPEGVPDKAATVLNTAREMVRHSYYCYEFSTAAVLHSLIAVEAVLRATVPDAGKQSLQKLIRLGLGSGKLTAEQADVLDAGREIRNRMAHGEMTGTALPPAMAIPMVRTSFAIVAALCTPASC